MRFATSRLSRNSQIQRSAAAFRLDGFTLEATTSSSLKNCEPGKCDVQLPAEAMDAFKQSVNWSAPDAATQANQLAQKMALEAIPAIHTGRERGPWNLHG